jgi:hypothetical protein
MYISRSVPTFAFLFFVFFRSRGLDLPDFIVDGGQDAEPDYMHELEYKGHLIYLIYTILINLSY